MIQYQACGNIMFLYTAANNVNLITSQFHYTCIFTCIRIIYLTETVM